MSDRVLELAMEALKARREAIEKEIESLRLQMSGKGSSGPSRTRRSRKSGTRKVSAAARLAQSQRMKEYWAKRKKLQAEKARSGAAAKKAAK